jgi:hypothetical protein
MDRLVAMSGKFVLLDKLLPKLQAEGHRVSVPDPVHVVVSEKSVFFGSLH